MVAATALLRKMGCVCGRTESCEQCAPPKKERRAAPTVLEIVSKCALSMGDDAWVDPELREINELRKTGKKKKADKLEREHWLRKEEERKAAEADERDKRNRTGKYDPKNNPVGRCRVCPDGDVIEKLKTVQSNPGLISPGNKHYKVHDYYHCNSCGLMYAFPPKVT